MATRTSFCPSAERREGLPGFLRSYLPSNPSFYILFSQTLIVLCERPKMFGNILLTFALLSHKCCQQPIQTCLCALFVPFSSARAILPWTGMHLLHVLPSKNTHLNASNSCVFVLNTAASTINRRAIFVFTIINIRHVVFSPLDLNFLDYVGKMM